MAIDAKITSNCSAFKAGMMPSQLTSTTWHFSANFAHRAFITSISQPTQFPDVSLKVKGGYGSAATPKRMSAYSAVGKTKSKANQLAKINESFFMEQPLIVSFFYATFTLDKTLQCR